MLTAQDPLHTSTTLCGKSQRPFDGPFRSCGTAIRTKKSAPHACLQSPKSKILHARGAEKDKKHQGSVPKETGGALAFSQRYSDGLAKMSKMGSSGPGRDSTKPIMYLTIESGWNRAPLAVTARSPTIVSAFSLVHPVLDACSGRLLSELCDWLILYPRGMGDFADWGLRPSWLRVCDEALLSRTRACQEQE